MNGDYECMICGYTEHNPISQTCPSCHHTTLSAMTSDADEIDKLESKIARLVEAGDKMANMGGYCCTNHERWQVMMVDTDSHSPDCPVTLWNKEAHE